MAEQRPIVYKSVGFTLGLGGAGGAGAAAGASSSLLDTLLSSVPSAKALLPTIVPHLTKPKAVTGAGTASQQNECLASAGARESAGPCGKPCQAQASSPKQKPLQQSGNTEQQPAEGPKGATTAAAAASGKVPPDVISLLSDSESEPPCALARNSPKESPAARPAANDDGTGKEKAGKEADTKPVSAEFIPLPHTGPTTALVPSTASKAAAPGSADALAEEEEIRLLGKKPYWMSYVSRIDSPLLRLHQELVELCELVQPTPEEAAARRGAVAAVTEVVKSIWPQARCEIFGSYATGLYVPTSDIDLVILDSGCSNVQSGLKALATALGKRSIAQSLQVIGKARVPIVKFETVEYGNLLFDVSFDVANGPQAALLVAEMTGSWPMMRPLILCLKLFLQQRELNEVYTGGIGSYALITLVAAFLQLHGSRRQPVATGGGQAVPVYGTEGDAALGWRSGGVEPGLGVLLVDFFRFYGRVVNTVDVGIRCGYGGQFFRKVDRDAPDGPRGFTGWLSKERTYLLSVEDPKDASNDVCRNSFNIMRVKTAFEYAYQMLTAPSRPDESLLARILRLGPILASRPRPRVPHLRELGYYCQPPGRDERVKQQRATRREKRKKQQQQGGKGLEGAEASPSGRGGKDGGRKSVTPGRGNGREGKKRGREGAAGGGGGGGDVGAKGAKGGEGTAGGKKARTEPAAKGNKEKRQRQRESTSMGGRGGGEGEVGGRAQKRRREEAAPVAAGDATPARGAKRPRREGRQQQNGSGNGAGGGSGGGGRARDDGGRPQQPFQHHGNNSHGHQQPAQQRRPALMQVVVPVAPPPVAAAPPQPAFHPGYAPPPTQSHLSRHQHQRHQHSNDRGPQSRPHHHSSHHHGQDRGGGGGYGGGAQGTSYGRGPQQPPPQQHPQGPGRPRAPIMMAQGHPYPQGQRGQQPDYYGQRTHVFFD